MKFEHASQATAKALDFLVSAKHCVREEEFEQAEEFVRAAGLIQKHYGPAILDNQELIRVADVVHYHHAHGRCTYNSAHVAVLKISYWAWAAYLLKRPELAWEELELVDYSHLASLLKRERAKLLNQPIEDSDEVRTSARAIEMLLGEDNKEVLAIVNGDASTGDKIKKIVEIDCRFLGYSSPKWAELLGVTEAAVRKSPIWKEMQKRRKAPD